MGESAGAQSVPSAAGAPSGLLAVEVQRAATAFPAWPLCAGPVPAPLNDERNEPAYALLVMPSGPSQAEAAGWRDGLSQAPREPGSGRGRHPHRYRSAGGR